MNTIALIRIHLSDLNKSTSINLSILLIGDGDNSMDELLVRFIRWITDWILNQDKIWLFFWCDSDQTALTESLIGYDLPRRCNTIESKFWFVYVDNERLLINSMIHQTIDQVGHLHHNLESFGCMMLSFEDRVVECPSMMISWAFSSRYCRIWVLSENGRISIGRTVASCRYRNHRMSYKSTRSPSSHGDNDDE